MICDALHSMMVNMLIIIGIVCCMRCYNVEEAYNKMIFMILVLPSVCDCTGFCQRSQDKEPVCIHPFQEWEVCLIILVTPAKIFVDMLMYVYVCFYIKLYLRKNCIFSCFIICHNSCRLFAIKLGKVTKELYALRRESHKDGTLWLSMI